MNAKHLTLTLSACVLLLGNFALLPAWNKHKSLASAKVLSQSQSKQAQEYLAQVKNLPARPMQLSDSALALASAVNSWSSASIDYGITISQLVTSEQSAGQSVVDINSLRQIDPLTQLPLQRLLIKGQYQSLTEFEEFLTREVNAEQAVRIDRLKINGNSFELEVAIFSKAQ